MHLFLNKIRKNTFKKLIIRLNKGFLETKFIVFNVLFNDYRVVLIAQHM